jgi:hypothetical protein
MTTGTRRRRAADWRTLVEEWQQSGETREVFAAARGFRPTTLGWWASEHARRRRAGAADKETSTGGVRAAFLPLHVVGETARPRGAAVAVAAAERTASLAEIVLGGGRVLRVPVGADASWVGQIAAVLQVGERC